MAKKTAKKYSSKQKEVNIKITAKNKASIQKRRIWFYFPIPFAFNISFFSIVFFSLFNKPELDSLLESSVLKGELFMQLSLLLFVTWLLGNVSSFLVSPIFYEFNKKISLQKLNITFPKVFLISLALFIWVLCISLLSSGIQQFTMAEYRSLISPVIYGFGFAYTYFIMAFGIWLANRKK